MTWDLGILSCTFQSMEKALHNLDANCVRTAIGATHRVLVHDTSCFSVGVVRLRSLQ